MLSTYARHYPPCTQTDINYKRCRCPKWINGTIERPAKVFGKTIGPGFVRFSAQTRSWERAEKLVREADDASHNLSPARSMQFVAAEIKRTKLDEAVKAFREDEDSRNLSKETTKQSKTLLESQLVTWASEHGIEYLDEFTAAHASKFRSSWKNTGSTSERKRVRLIGFFDWCMQHKLTGENPARVLKPAASTSPPTDYFRPAEFEKIIDATYTYAEWRGGRDFVHRAERVRALLLTMRWAGLAIQDAVTLERDRLQENNDGDNQIFLYRAKTGVPVYVVVPPDVADLLRALPGNERYFFWSGTGEPQTACKGWRRTLTKVFAAADLKTADGRSKRCHPHMFRDTFAVELLLRGATLDQIALLLGHSSVKITEKHYAPFCRERQVQLAATAKLAWQAADSPTSKRALRRMPRVVPMRARSAAVARAGS